MDYEQPSQKPAYLKDGTVLAPHNAYMVDELNRVIDRREADNAAIAKLTADVDVAVSKALAGIDDVYTKEEVSTFPLQLAEAKEFLLNEQEFQDGTRIAINADGVPLYELDYQVKYPMLSAVASTRNTPVREIAKVIVENHSARSKAVAKVFFLAGDAKRKVKYKGLRDVNECAARILAVGEAFAKKAETARGDRFVAEVLRAGDGEQRGNVIDLGQSGNFVTGA